MPGCSLQNYYYTTASYVHTMHCGSTLQPLTLCQSSFLSECFLLSSLLLGFPLKKTIPRLTAFNGGPQTGLEEQVSLPISRRAQR